MKKRMITGLLNFGMLLLFNVSVKSQTITPNTDVQAPAGTIAVHTAPVAYPANPPTDPIINLVREWEPTYPDTVSSDIISNAGNLQMVKQTTQYFDGLGRPLQTVARKMAPNAKDMVSPVVYDAYGLESFKYLPYAETSNDGEFKIDPFTDQASFMASYDPASGENYYYSQTDYEASPLNRVIKTYAPGNSWVGNARGVSVSYLVNTSTDAVHMWNIGFNETDMPTNGGIYDPGQLTKTITTDEKNSQVVEYKDKEGHVILKKVASGTTTDNDPYTNWLCTYYVYDDLGRLRFVMQPNAVDYLLAHSWAFDGSPANWTNSTIAQGYCFGYVYDERGRMIVKHVPDGGEMDMVYDSRDRLIMTQDANLKGQNKWLVTVYDALNRPVQTGLKNSNSSRTTIQGNVLNSLYYPDISTGFVSLSETFYDSYQWISDNSISLKAVLIQTNLSTAQYFYTPDDVNFPYAQAVVASYQNRNMVTGTKVQVLGTTNYLYSVNFYDDHGRLIQTQSMNYSNPGVVVKDTVTTQYSFSGQVLRTLIAHKKSGTNTQNYRVGTKNIYDDAGRLTKITKIIGNQLKTSPENTISSISYDKMGQLSEKDLGQQVDALNSSYSYLSTPIDILNYSYNIRGWLRGINKDYARGGGSGSPWFGMELCYDYGFNSPQLNGNISGERWRSRGDGEQRAYGFSYDMVNRLTSANYSQLNVSTWDKTKTDFTASNLTYDDNGNIKTMNQMGMNINTITSLDQLQYSYVTNSNRLNYVKDNSSGWSSTLGDFKEVNNNTSQDYTYDANGNLTKDYNKGIGNTTSNGITYNYLNLPSVINIPGKGTINYFYDAAGNKLVKITDEPASASNNNTHTSTTTSYFGPFEYVRTDVTPNGGSLKITGPLLQYISTEEGRARPATPGNVDTFYYDYFEKDHLGNTRVVLTDQIKQDVYPVADMESSNTAALTTEKQYYDIQDANIIDESLITNFNGTSTNEYQNNNGNPPYNNNPSAHTSDNSTKLYKVSAGGNTGLGITLRVMSGDVVDIYGKSFYHSNNQTLNNTSGIGSSVLLNLITNFAGSNPVQTVHAGISGTQVQTNPGTGQGVSDWLSNVPTPSSSTVPKAYINWVLLDDRLQVIQSGSGFDLVSTTPDQLKPHHKTVTIPANGFLYVYCSNQSNIDVFFDNLQVIQTHGPLVQETHYYPFGLTMAGISSQALGFGGSENKHLYSGKEKQNKEFTDGSGLELYDFGARMQDPQLGVWHNVDPLAEKFMENTPYSYASDNPMRFIDPNGMENKDANQNDGDRKVNYMDVMDKAGKITRIWDYADDKDAAGNEPNTEQSTGLGVGDHTSVDLSQAVQNPRPSYSNLSSNYPTGKVKDVATAIGGQVQNYYDNFRKTHPESYPDAGDNEANSCALRMSRALNTSGFDVNRKLLPNAYYLTGSDNKDYLIRVADMIKYLNKAFGAPDVIKVPTINDVTPGDLQGKQGIIAFNVEGWSDATGHVTLFDGTSCVYGSYFQADLNKENESTVKTKKVSLWTLK